MSTFLKKGWNVKIAGFRGKGPIPEEWSFIELPYYRRFSHAPNLRRPWKRITARFKDTVRFDQTLQIIPGLAEWCCWRQPIYSPLLKIFGNQKFERIMCHDHSTFPLAFHLLKDGGEVYADLHEHALWDEEQETLAFLFYIQPEDTV